MREIEQAAGGGKTHCRSASVNLLPLHGSLEAREQDDVLQPPPKREARAIIATNIAETSLTVPGVTAVIDTGLHRWRGTTPIERSIRW